MIEKTKKTDGDTSRPVFEEFSEEKIREIVRMAKKRTVSAGTLLFKQDEPGDSFYIINSGKVRVYKKDESGTELELSVMGPGESFGEMALLTGEPRSANVETLEETQLTVFGKEQFEKVLRDNPDLSIHFVKQLSTWLRKDEKKLEEEARQRGPSLSWLDFVVILVIGLLCGIVFNTANPNGIDLFPKGFSDTASFLVEPETVMNEFQGDVIFIDARPATFFNERHIKGAVNLPYALFDIMYMVLESQIDEAAHIIIYGRTISSRYDENVTHKLNLYGYQNVHILSGGLNAWRKKGYPTEP